MVTATPGPRDSQALPRVTSDEGTQAWSSVPRTVTAPEGLGGL